MNNSEIPSDKELTIKLQAQQWAIVLQVLAEGPYKVVQPLIENIVKQAQSQNEVAEAVPNGAIPEQPRVN